MINEENLDSHSLEKILEEKSPEALNEFLRGLSTEDRVWVVSNLDSHYYESLMQLLEPKVGAQVLYSLSESQARDFLQSAEPGKAAAIADELQSDFRADIIGGMNSLSTEAVLKLMDPEEAEDVKELIDYAPTTAGGLMITEYLYYTKKMTIREIIKDMQDNGEYYANFMIQYAYIVSEKEELLGVLPIRDMLFTNMNKTAEEVMIKNPIHVKADTELSELERIFDQKKFFGIPVINDKDQLVGVLRGAAVEEAIASKANQTLLKLSGIIGGEELRNMGLTKRFSRRLAFLSLNIVLNIVAASVIAMNMDVLDKVIALAVFMPIISDMSGCSGNQAVAVSIRELALGILKPRDYMRVFIKEASVGVINGFALGFLIGGVAILWKGNFWLGVVVGSALCINTIVAVCFGGLVPLILKKMKVDPALMSGPMLTTVTDMCGFFLVLTLASQMMSYLL